MNTDPKAPLTSRPFAGKFEGLQSLRVVRPLAKAENETTPDETIAVEPKVVEKKTNRRRSGPRNDKQATATQPKTTKATSRFPVTYAQVNEEEERRQPFSALFTLLLFKKKLA